MEEVTCEYTTEYLHYVLFHRLLNLMDLAIKKTVIRSQCSKTEISNQMRLTESSTTDSKVMLTVLDKCNKTLTLVSKWDVFVQKHIQ